MLSMTTSPLHPDVEYLRGSAYAIAAVTIWVGWMAITRLSVISSLNVWDIAALHFSVAWLVLFAACTPVCMAWQGSCRSRIISWVRSVRFVSIFVSTGVYL